MERGREGGKEDTRGCFSQEVCDVCGNTPLFMFEHNTIILL